MQMGFYVEFRFEFHLILRSGKTGGPGKGKGLEEPILYMQMQEVIYRWLS